MAVAWFMGIGDILLLQSTHHYTAGKEMGVFGWTVRLRTHHLFLFLFWNTEWASCSRIKFATFFRSVKCQPFPNPNQYQPSTVINTHKLFSLLFKGEKEKLASIIASPFPQVHNFFFLVQFSTVPVDEMRCYGG